MKYGAALLAVALVIVGPSRAGAQTTATPGADVAPSDTSRLFIGPTGRMLAPGQGYITFDAVFVPTVEVGITRRFSMGAGTPLIIGNPHPFWVTPKVQIFEDERTSVAAGVIHMFVPGEGSGGFGYVVGTIGTVEKSTTIGGGVFYGDDSDDREPPSITPVVLFGLERRFLPRVSFITENYLGVAGGMVTGGFRWRFQDWQVNLAGVVAFVFDEGVVPGLWFSFAYKFGNK